MNGQNFDENGHFVTNIQKQKICHDSVLIGRILRVLSHLLTVSGIWGGVGSIPSVTRFFMKNICKCYAYDFLPTRFFLQAT